jgi:tetratricopeptide (TPR) repeat protein
MKLQLKPFLAVALLALAAPGRSADAPVDQAAAEQAQQAKQMDAGRAFTPEQVKAAEARLQANPKDLDTCCQLLGYYSPERTRSEEKKELWKHFAPLVLGIIENHPETDLAGQTGAMLLARFYELEDQGDWEKGAALWDKLMAANPTNAQIVGQAAVYRSWDLFRSQTQTLSLFEKACQLEPKNPKWPRLLGKMYSQQASFDRSPELAGKALAMLERAVSLAGPTLTLEDDAVLAMASGQAEQWGKVFQYGTNAIARLDPAKRDWNYGNVVHDVNAMLCLAALHDGDKKLAGEYLLRAGRSPGSPQLGSFGPDFSYAAKMLKAGETNVVLQYLDLVGNFWGNTNRPKRYIGDDFDLNTSRTLEKYRQDIRAGKIPAEGRWTR